MLKTLFALLIGAALLLGLLFLNQRIDNGPSATPIEAGPKRIRVNEVQQQSVTRSLRFPGTTQATKTARLAFATGGTLTGLPLVIGERVKKGQRVGELYNPQLQPNNAAALNHAATLHSHVVQLEQELLRVHALPNASEDELKRIRAERDKLRTASDAARTQLDKASLERAETALHAPFAGTVDALFFATGEFVPAGQPVIALSGTGAMEVRIEVPELLLPQLAVGQAVKISFPYRQNLSLSGRIVELVKDTTGPDQQFPVVIQLPLHHQLLPGLTAEVLFEHREQEQLLLPIHAVTDPGSGEQRVFRYVDGKVQAVTVQVGVVRGSQLTLVGDSLQAGDLVVTAGHRHLTDGDLVELLP